MFNKQKSLQVVKKEILTIENSSAIGYLISTVLKKDYTVTRVSSCNEALKQLQGKAEKDLIILDIPDSNSENYELLKHISTSSVLSNIRTVVISNSDDEQLKNKTVELGASLFLTKPFDPVFLSSRVKDLVEDVKANTSRKKRRIPFSLNIF